MINRNRNNSKSAMDKVLKILVDKFWSEKGETYYRMSRRVKNLADYLYYDNADATTANLNRIKSRLAEIKKRKK